MEVDDNDIKLIKEIHNQFHSTKDEEFQNGLRYVLKDILGRYLIQIKHYEPWVSKQAEKEIKKELKKDFPNIKISQIKLHDCNVKNPVSLSEKQRKLFVKGNSYNKLFHLEHDPPTIQVVNSILEEEKTDSEKIKKKLKPYRLCFITVKENDKLNEKGYRSIRKIKKPYAYEVCGINVKKVNNG
jgi:hypothetical protein